MPWPFLGWARQSQALLDDEAALACMSYVDLNPVRAGMAETPEASDFPSIQQRMRHYAAKGSAVEQKEAQDDIALIPLIKQGGEAHPSALGFTLEDYLELVDWAGRVVREDKQCAIPSQIPLMHSISGPNGTYLKRIAGFTSFRRMPESRNTTTIKPSGSRPAPG